MNGIHEVDGSIPFGSTKPGGWRQQVPAPFAFRGPEALAPRDPQSLRSAIEAR